MKLRELLFGLVLFVTLLAPFAITIAAVADGGAGGPITPPPPPPPPSHCRGNNPPPICGA